MKKTGRNDVCGCGSGKKYKKCCLAIDEAMPVQARVKLSPSELTRIGKLIPVLAEAMSGLSDREEDSLESLEVPSEHPDDFQGLSASVEEEIGWLSREGDSDLDIVLARWLDKCETMEEREIFETRLARLRGEQPDLYFKQTPAYTALLRVINALEMGRLQVVQEVIDDGQRLVQGDNEANSYGSMLRLLGWHEELGLMVRAAETAMPGLPGANLLKSEERLYTHWAVNGRMLFEHGAEDDSFKFQPPASDTPDISNLFGDFLAWLMARDISPARALLQAAETETYLWNVVRYQGRRQKSGTWVPKTDAVQAYLLDLPVIQSLVLLSALPEWRRFLRPADVLDAGGDSEYLQGLRPLVDTIVADLRMTGQVRHDAAQLLVRWDSPVLAVVR